MILTRLLAKMKRLRVGEAVYVTFGMGTEVGSLGADAKINVGVQLKTELSGTDSSGSLELACQFLALAATQHRRLSNDACRAFA